MDKPTPRPRPNLRPSSRVPSAGAGLLELVRSARPQPVFVTGGPPARPFAGPGTPAWMNPAYALHHAESWRSPFVLGAMLPLEAAAHPHERAGSSLLSRYRAVMTELAEAPLPLVAQVWGPMTMAATLAGLETYVESLAGGKDAYTLTNHGLDVTLAVAEAALEARPLVLWIGEPLAALADPGALLSTWLPVMRQLIALARAAGADPVVHVSGAATHVLDALNRTGTSGISITADTPLAAARAALAPHVVVFGNLDSMRLLDREEEWLREQGARMTEEMRGRPFVATPGSAVPERIPVSKLAAFVEGARDV